MTRSSTTANSIREAKATCCSMSCLIPMRGRDFGFEVPLWEFGLPDEASIEVQDVIHGNHFTWHGKTHVPFARPACTALRHLATAAAGRGTRMNVDANRSLDGVIDRSVTDWYKDAIIYQVHVKAYQDSDGDGVGDFAGLMSRLDHIQELGATAIWLLPFYPSPLRDDGYDIADYKSINPSLRDDGRFQGLRGARRTGAACASSPNSSSTTPRDQHPWFQKARRRRRAARSGTSTSGRTTTTSGPRRGSSSPTRKSRTGPGTTRRSNITGTASSATSRT